MIQQTLNIKSLIPVNLKINRELFDLSWRTKGIYDAQITPLISDMYLRPNERFNKLKEWDERKYYYGENGSGKEILISPDRDVWAKQSTYPHDIYYNLAEHYSRGNENLFAPVIGLLGTQIQAFLDYEKQKLQQKLDQAGYEYKVHLSLPTQEEIKLADTVECDCKMVYSTEKIDMTERWRITNEEYWEFVLWVQDSILREAVYLNSNPIPKDVISNEKIGEMLNYPEVYYDEINTSWVEFDAAQPYINRQLFPFDFDYNWKKEIPSNQYLPLVKMLFIDPEKFTDKKGNIDHKEFKPQQCFYRYYWKDLRRQAQTGNLEWNDQWQRYDLKDKWEGRDFDADRKIQVGHKSGVRRHADYNRFTVLETVNIYPGAICQICNAICLHEHGADKSSGENPCNKCPDDWNLSVEQYDFWQNPEALVKNLTYPQALAYYHWKYQRKKTDKKMISRIYHDLVPSEEQFNQVQKGQSIVLEEKEVEFPDPWFRYVIHFYPKN